MKKKRKPGIKKSKSWVGEWRSEWRNREI